MEEEQYCLKWNNHQTTLLTVLTGLMDTERLADCILSAEGKTLKAHQVIISACSPYLERLLNDSRQPGYMPILIFSDLAYDELVAMKEYMYKGEVNIRQDALDSFLKAACNLQIKGLADGGGGGGADEGGGGSKRKAPPDIADSPVRAGRRRRRESRESDNQEMVPEQLAQPIPAKKQNVFTAKVEPFEPAPVVKMEPIMDQPPMPQPQIQHTPQLVMKPEPQDHQPEPETHDLTGLDDDDDYDYEMPGTSQPDLSQDISSWQMDNSMHSAEDFAASQSMNTSASQPGQSSQGLGIVIKNITSLMPDVVTVEKANISKSITARSFDGIYSDSDDKSILFSSCQTEREEDEEREEEAEQGEVELDEDEGESLYVADKTNADEQGDVELNEDEGESLYVADKTKADGSKKGDATTDGKVKEGSQQPRCPYCPYQIDSIKSFEQHLKLIHYELKSDTERIMTALKDNRLESLVDGKSDKVVVFGQGAVGETRKCPYCRYQWSTRNLDGLNEHLLYQHNKKRRISLLNEIKQFLDYQKTEGNSVEQLLSNSSREKEQEGYECPVCSVKSLDMPSFLDHLKQNHPQMDIQTILKQCGIAYYEEENDGGQKPSTSESTVERRYPQRFKQTKKVKSKEKISEKPRKRKCRHCSYVIRDFSNFRKHLIRKHPSLNTKIEIKKIKGGDLPHLQRCPFCSYNYRTLDCLRNHLHRMHPNVDRNNILAKLRGKQYKCNNCGKFYLTAYLLQVHQRYEKLKPIHACEHCPYKAKLKVQLLRHILREH